MAKGCQFVPPGSSRPVLCLSTCSWQDKESLELSLSLTRQTRLMWDTGHLCQCCCFQLLPGLVYQGGGKSLEMAEQRPGCELCSLLRAPKGAPDPSQTPNPCLGAPAAGIGLSLSFCCHSRSPGYRTPSPVLAGAISSLSWGQEDEEEKG